MSLDAAHRAEQELNSYQAKQGLGRKSDSVLESGVNEQVDKQFGGNADAKYGEVASSSAGNRRKIPPEEGGEIDDRGRMTEAKDFEGPGGPEDKVRMATERRPGDDDVPVPQELKHKGI
ncbi:hypothetical protein Plec18167_003397 [Paecilomyces lecythidis]|uniref:Uncharacterized protein n=2 Tax=Paecilomyces TaxID=33202 RepID=V5GAB0_BYSSN|nr:hypothetical protein NFIA_021080 [Paecilomyces variotii No. 5]